MSLINQMLQDLDARRAANGTASGLPNDVRPLPAAPRSRGPLLFGVGVVLVLLVALVWPRIVGQLPDAPLLAAPPSLAPPADAVAEAAKAPVAEPALSASPARQTILAEVEGVDASLRLANFLHSPPERKPAAKASLPAPTAVPAALPPAAPVTAAAKEAAPSSIEKSAPTGTLRERADADYRKAVAALNQGRLPEAVEGLRGALRQDGLHAAARQLLFKLLVEDKRFDEAGELLQQGLQAQPAQIAWAMSLARLQVDRGDLPAAWQTLQRSLPAAAESADYQGFAAHVLQRLGRGGDAVGHYQAATRLAPGEGRWWLGLGLALDAAEQPAEARDAFLRARASGTLNADLVAIVDQKLR